MNILFKKMGFEKDSGLHKTFHLIVFGIDSSQGCLSFRWMLANVDSGVSEYLSTLVYHFFPSYYR